MKRLNKTESSIFFFVLCFQRQLFRLLFSYKHNDNINGHSLYKFLSPVEKEQQVNGRPSRKIMSFFNWIPIPSLIVKYLQNVAEKKKNIVRIPYPMDRIYHIGYKNRFLATITKTRLFKYIENLTSKNWKFLDKKFWYFFLFLLKNIDCGTR